VSHGQNYFSLQCSHAVNENGIFCHHNSYSVLSIIRFADYRLLVTGGEGEKQRDFTPIARTESSTQTEITDYLPKEEGQPVYVLCI
jgi:hypothetical protein